MHLKNGGPRSSLDLIARHVNISPCKTIVENFLRCIFFHICRFSDSGINKFRPVGARVAHERRAEIGDSFLLTRLSCETSSRFETGKGIYRDLHCTVICNQLCGMNTKKSVLNLGGPLLPALNERSFAHCVNTASLIIAINTIFR